MTHWPLWRLLVWVEAWLLVVAGWHRWRPVHEDFLVPLLVAVGPGVVAVGFWAAARAFAGGAAVGGRAASVGAIGMAVLALLGALGWAIEWAVDAHGDVQRLDAMLGTSTLIIDVSLTWLSGAAALAALALDWLLSAARAPYRRAFGWLRRGHLVVTVLHLATLFGAAWLLMRWPEAGGDPAALFERARVTLHVYEYARATVLPVQACFAAAAVAVAAFDSRA